MSLRVVNDITTAHTRENSVAFFSAQKQRAVYNLSRFCVEFEQLHRDRGKLEYRSVRLSFYVGPLSKESANEIRKSSKKALQIYIYIYNKWNCAVKTNWLLFRVFRRRRGSTLCDGGKTTTVFFIIRVYDIKRVYSHYDINFVIFFLLCFTTTAARSVITSVYLTCASLSTARY